MAVKVWVLPTWRELVAGLTEMVTPWAGSMRVLPGLPTPARLPANLLQAQRDYFGAHTYERTDKPRGQFYHLDWSSAGREQVKV